MLQEQYQEDASSVERSSAHTFFAFEKTDSRDSDSTNSESDDTTKTTSIATMNVANEASTTIVTDHAIKQEPDNVVSTAFDDDTVKDEISPENVKSTVIVVKTEVTNTTVYDEETDVEE